MSQLHELAPSRSVTDRSKCTFYHTMDLPGGTVTGPWDLRGRIGDYTGGVDMSGKSVIDVGTASGFLSFEMEKLGADVVSFDAESAEDIAFVPIHDQPYVTDYALWKNDNNKFLDRLKNGYWYAHRELGSSASAVYGDVYRLGSYGRMFDVAMMGAILVHLKDPVNAIASVASICRDTLIITESTIDSPEPDARLCAHTMAGDVGYMWWLCSVPFYRDVLAMQNFEITSVTSNSFACKSAYCTGDIPLTTIVARRRK